jgi:hypothetical protein
VGLLLPVARHSDTAEQSHRVMRITARRSIARDRAPIFRFVLSAEAALCPYLRRLRETTGASLSAKGAVLRAAPVA